jgi:hypothetical protein
MAKHILKPLFRIMKAPSNELYTFMMQIVDGKFSCRIMNLHRKLPGRLRDADSRLQNCLLSS